MSEHDNPFIYPTEHLVGRLDGAQHRSTLKLSVNADWRDNVGLESTTHRIPGQLRAAVIDLSNYMHIERAQLLIQIISNQI